MAAKGARKWGVCGHTFRNISCTFGHFPYEFGARFCGKHNFRGGSLHSREDRKESGRHHAKGTRYVANSLAALLGASAAIWSISVFRRSRRSPQSPHPHATRLQRDKCLHKYQSASSQQPRVLSALSGCKLIPTPTCPWLCLCLSASFISYSYS